MVVGVIVIGRNEGERLSKCLRSADYIRAKVYIDSGSTDASCMIAADHGYAVVSLSNDRAFSAARARNAGIQYFANHFPNVEALQMVDGDCELSQDWISAATAKLAADQTVGVVFGRRRERHPEMSVYNMMCDDEWDGPVGEAESCGGDALFRVSALSEVGGYRDSLIAGEEPDLCLRIRRCGWKILRIAPDMTVHDASLMHFRQWWIRAKRGGHAVAELVDIHRHNANRSWIRATHKRSILVSDFVGQRRCADIRLAGRRFHWDDGFSTALYIGSDADSKAD